jgi:hypothetical protein
VVVVVIDEPGGEEYYGGQVAAPVYAEVMARTMRVLGVPPDDPSVIKRRADLGPAPTHSTHWAYAPNAALTPKTGDGVVQ